MRLESKSCGADIWPIYNDVRAVKKKCRPPKETISIHENVAEVAVQPLLNHTAKRIIIYNGYASHSHTSNSAKN